jgi:hypothetical protein
MPNVLKMAVISVFGSLLGASAVQATTVTFDNLPALPTFWAGNPVPAVDRLSNQLISADGIGFSSAAPYVAVVDNCNCMASPPNMIGGVTKNGILSYKAPVIFTFYAFDASIPGSVTSFSLTGDLWGGGDVVTLYAYDLLGNLVATDTETDRGGTVWSVSGQSIHSVVWPGNPSEPGGIGLDNVTFTMSGAAVPEPGPLPVLAEGLGILLLVRSGRRTLGTIGRGALLFHQAEADE